jgi:peptide-methionine (S)-S-oxide reductase
MKNNEIAVLGTGCFWCTEAIFKSLRGAVNVSPGYAGGHSQNPSYPEVSSGETGHAEVVRIEFDPEILPYEDLLEVFWNVHDPTTLNRQGNDVGTQYRSIILYSNKKQKEIAEKSMRQLIESHSYKDPVVTEIKPLENFYNAEKYHWNYYENNSNAPYCRLVISPKLQHLREKYSTKLK